MSKVLDILTFPDERLTQISAEVEVFDKPLHALLDDMAVTMYRSKGIGLAAPQVGKLVRLFVIDLGHTEGEEQKLYEFINPKISHTSGKIKYEEGCLSVPGYTEEVVRKANIQVDYQDRNGKAQTLEAHDLLAVAIQHENDHLDGILFLDRLSPLKRKIVKKRLAKAVTL